MSSLSEAFISRLGLTVVIDGILTRATPESPRINQPLLMGPSSGMLVEKAVLAGGLVCMEGCGRSSLYAWCSALSSQAHAYRFFIGPEGL